MAKKTRTITKNPAPTFAGLQSAKNNAEVNFDYTIVKSDLKKIGILAGSFFAILVALSFIIN